MKRKHHLHELIRAMTAPEKRYFKRLAVTWKNHDNDYLVLFGHVHSMKEYDEQELRTRVGEKAFLKNLDVKKHYLYELILDALQQYHHKRMEKENAVVRVSLLIEKNLFQQAGILLEKSLEDARDRNDFLYELRLLQHQQMLVNIIPGGSKSDVTAMVNEAIRNYENLNTYELLLNQLQDLYIGYFFVRNVRQMNKLKAVVAHPLLSSVKRARTFLSKIYFYRIWFLYYSTTCQWENAYEMAVKAHAAIHNHPLARSYFGRTYLMCMNNMLAAALLTDGRLEELFSVHRQLEKEMRMLPSENLKLLAQTRLIQYRFLALLKKGDIEEVRKFLPEVVAFIEDHEDDIENYKIKILNFDVAKAYYLLGERKLANKWFLGIPAPDKNYHTADVFSFSRILYLINCIEGEEIRFIPQNVQTLRAQLKRWNLYYSFEKFLLSFIAREYIHVHSMTKQDKQIMLNSFLIRIREEHNKEWGKSIRLYYDFEKWALERLETC